MVTVLISGAGMRAIQSVLKKLRERSLKKGLTLINIAAQ